MENTIIQMVENAKRQARNENGMKETMQNGK